MKLIIIKKNFLDSYIYLVKKNFNLHGIKVSEVIISVTGRCFAKDINDLKLFKIF